MAETTATPGSTASVADRVIGLVLLAAFLLECLVAALFGTMLVMLTASCTPAPCNDGLIDAGMALGTIGQLVPAVAGVWWFAVRWSGGRRVWFVPLVLAPVPVLLLLVGEQIVQSGVV